MEDREKALDTEFGQAYSPVVVWNRSFPARRSTLTFNPNDEHPRTNMGSTTFGNVIPASMIGLSMPQDISINRTGLGRVRVMVAPS